MGRPYGARQREAGRPAGWQTFPVYLDYNATTPVDSRVAAVAAAYFDGGGFGNPSSEHAFGAHAHRAVATAREQVAAMIGAKVGEIVFTGSGSEADQLALRGAVLAAARRQGAGRTRVVTQATEHPAVLECCAALARWHGTEIVLLPVDADGLVAPAALAEALDRDTSAATVVSVMLANNETGAIQPLAAIADVARARGALVHADAAQAPGKIAVDVADLGVDLLTIVGHKMYAPKGIGALYVRSGIELEPVIYGGGQEGGLRSGTENVALIAALGTAAELVASELAAGAAAELAELRDRLYTRLVAGLPGGVRVNGPVDGRLPSSLNVSFRGLLGHELLEATPGVAASVGSACHSGIHQPSPVLSAMGLAPADALSAVRMSVGRWTTAEDVDAAADRLVSAARRLAAGR